MTTAPESNDANVIRTTAITTNDAAINTTSKKDAAGNGYREDLFRQWVAMETITYMITIWTIYLIISLAFHHKRRYVKKENQGRMRQRGKRFYIFDWLTITGAILALFRAIFGLDTIWGRTSDFNCTTMKMGRVLLAVFSYWVTYIILWYRQRILYNKPILATITNKFTRFLSIASIVVICITYTFGFFVYLLTGNYQATINGCIFKDESKVAEIKWYCTMASSIIFMTMLLALFIYPVIKQKRCNAECKISTAGNECDKLVRRALYATAVIIATDAVANLVIALVRNGVDEIGNFMTDLNLAANLICTIYCFSDWRNRLFAWYKKPEKIREQASDMQHTVSTIA